RGQRRGPSPAPRWHGGDRPGDRAVERRVLAALPRQRHRPLRHACELPGLSDGRHHLLPQRPGGSRPDDGMIEVRLLLTKAERSFRAAGILLSSGDSDFAASRAYYGLFYTAQALLLTQGLRFSRHGQVIAQYGLHFAKTRRLDPRFHRLLDEAFRIRQSADYTIEVPAPDLVRTTIQEGLHFLDEAFE